VDDHGAAERLTGTPTHPIKEHIMSTKMFVNLPVEDPKKSMAFFKTPGIFLAEKGVPTRGQFDRLERS
jgi:hypothetical protein